MRERDVAAVAGNLSEQWHDTPRHAAPRRTVQAGVDAGQARRVDYTLQAPNSRLTGCVPFVLHKAEEENKTLTRLKSDPFTFFPSNIGLRISLRSARGKTKRGRSTNLRRTPTVSPPETGRARLQTPARRPNLISFPCYSQIQMIHFRIYGLVSNGVIHV